MNSRVTFRAHPRSSFRAESRIENRAQNRADNEAQNRAELHISAGTVADLHGQIVDAHLHSGPNFLYFTCIFQESLVK